MDPIRTLWRCAAAACLAAVLLPGCTSQGDAGPESYRKIIIDPQRDPEAARRANEAGLACLDEGDVIEAELAFKRAIEHDNNFGPAHNHLGKVYFLKRNYYLAAHAFDTAAQLMPNHAAPFNNIGLTLVEAGELDDAIEQFRKAVTLDPRATAYQANLVRTLVQRGDEASDEVVTLLRSVAANDERVAWRVWASHQLGAMGLE